MDEHGADRELAPRAVDGEGVLTAPRLVFVVTMPVTADVLLRGQLAYLREAGFDVTVVSSPGPELDRVASREGVRVVDVPIAREISPGRDAVSLAKLTRTLRSLAPEIVNASTAKGGLLGMLAATAVRVPARVYQLRGLRLETEQGVKRTVLAMTERVATSCAHHVICNSESLRATYVASGFAPARKCRVLGSGSSNGIDVDRFARAHWSAQARSLRASLGIPDGAPVIGFMGRPHPDKGIRELLDAFAKVRVAVPGAHLVVVGRGFAGDELDRDLATRARQPNVHLVPRVDEPAPYYAVMDVLAFPSHREGLPNAPLEAAAAGVPTVGANATGTRDAVVDGETGTLVPIGDAKGLSRALIAYMTDGALRAKHGAAARARVVSEYARTAVWERWRVAYAQMLER